MGVEQCGTIAISPLGTRDRALNKLQDADTAAAGKLRELNFITQRNKYCFAKSYWEDVESKYISSNLFECSRLSYFPKIKTLSYKLEIIKIIHLLQISVSIFDCLFLFLKQMWGFAKFMHC